MPRPALARSILSTTLLVVASPAFAIECFSMYDAKNTLVYQSSTTPIDLSRSISTQMARSFPSRSLVIADSGSCPEVGVTPAGTATQAAALLPARLGDGTGVFGADTAGAAGAGTTSPAPTNANSPSAGDAGVTRTVTRAPAGRR